MNRFEIRYNNGVLHVFDTHAYCAIEAYAVTKMELAANRIALLNADK